jgi:hypothetical protein|nr:MAG TPA: hypothetical protein [Caudoviricetes sp.]
MNKRNRFNYNLLENILNDDFDFLKEKIKLSEFKKLTETEYCKIKKLINETSNIGYMTKYFDNKNDYFVWIDPEFSDCGWIWADEIFTELNVDLQLHLKQNVKEILKYAVKQKSLFKFYKDEATDETILIVIPKRKYLSSVEEASIFNIYFDYNEEG